MQISKRLTLEWEKEGSVVVKTHTSHIRIRDRVKLLFKKNKRKKKFKGFKVEVGIKFTF